MAAAMELASRGYKPLLFEKRSFPGGRAYSFVDKVSGETLDNGQHITIGAYQYFYRLLEMLGARNFIEHSDRLSVPFVTNEGLRYIIGGGRLSAKLSLLLSFLNAPTLSTKSKLAIAHFVSRIKSIKSELLEGETAESFLRKFSQTDDACNNFWKPLAVSAMNTQLEIADASVFLNILRTGFLAGGSSGALALPLKPLSMLFSEFQTKFEALGGRIIWNTTINEISVDSSSNITLSANSGERIECNALISAIPANVLSSILNNSKTNVNLGFLHDDFESSPILSAYFWLDGALRFEHTYYSLLGGKSHWLFDKCSGEWRYGGNKNEHLLTVTISAASQFLNRSHEEISIQIFEELKQYFPEIRKRQLIRSRVIIERNATYAATPKAEHAKRKLEHVAGSIFLAGDWTVAGLPATLESAARSGFAAAERVIRTMSKSVNT